MSRLRQALAATTMAVAAAAGGLLIAAAGAGPAYASTPAAPAAHHRGHTMTITAHPAIRPRTEFPCAVKPGAAMKPAGCLDPTIHCHLAVSAPFVDTAGDQITANATATCDATVPRISLHETLVQSGVPLTPVSDPEPDTWLASTFVSTECQIGTYTNTADALITFPAGYVLSGGSNPMHATSPAVQVPPFGCLPPPPPGGGGGGGGCAIPVPSPAGHPAGRHPDLITCH